MKRILKRTWLLIQANALLAALVGLLSNVAAGVFSSLSPWIALIWVCVVTVLITVLTRWQERQQSTSETSVAAAHENRQRMLKLVQNKWITGFLENPLYYGYDEQLLSLPLRTHVGSHFDLVLFDPLAPTHPILSGTTITQVFDQAQGELLILGKPGAGKTTLLLELARDLLKRAKDNEAAPIPVVLMLASWATEKLPLEQWIVKELRTKYDVPSQIREEWVKANELLLLLDGLDEVTPDVLPACTKAINEYYHQSHRSLVVCSRTKEFLGQPGRLALHTAVIVQPLSSEQVDTYLDSLAAKGEEIEGLKHILHQNETLSTLATTPLFLTVLILAYHGKPVQELLALGKAAPIDQPHLLFHNYVEQMLQRKGTHIHTPAQQTKRWLAWLARQLTAHQQSELYLEQLQPDWLPKGQRAFYWWSMGLVGALGWGLVGALFGPVFGLVSGLVGALFGLGWGLVLEIKPVEALTWSRGGASRIQVFGPLLVLPLMLLFGLVFGLAFGLVGALVAALLGLLLVLASGLGTKQLTERSMLSPNEGIRRSVKNGLVGGLVGWLVVAPNWLIGGLVLGLLRDGPVGGLALGLRDGLVLGLHDGPVFGLVSGLGLGLGLGLGATVQHYTLRFWLWCMHLFPWQAVSFLDDAVEQLLLRKVGGGYVFRHRLLQEYFASLEANHSSDGKAGQVLQTSPSAE